jgi:hypothetical protein
MLNEMDRNMNGYNLIQSLTNLIKFRLLDHSCASSEANYLTI